MRGIIFILLIVICKAPWAEWEYPSKTSDGKVTIYADKSTIRRSGEIAKMWTLQNYNVYRTNSQRKKYRSEKALVAHNCKEEIVALISLVTYSDLWGKGNVVDSYTWNERDWEWDPIAPGGTGATQWEIACSIYILRLEFCRTRFYRQFTLCDDGIPNPASRFPANVIQNKPARIGDGI